MRCRKVFSVFAAVFLLIFHIGIFPAHAERDKIRIGFLIQSIMVT